MRGEKILCLGPSAQDAMETGGDRSWSKAVKPLVCVPGATGDKALDSCTRDLLLLTSIGAVVCWVKARISARHKEVTLSKRDGPLIIIEEKFGHQCLVERHVYGVTTAAGDVSLLTH
jgi:hypothetical protein